MTRGQIMQNPYNSCCKEIKYTIWRTRLAEPTNGDTLTSGQSHSGLLHLPRIDFYLGQRAAEKG